jgi:hypothetical protein
LRRGLQAVGDVLGVFIVGAQCGIPRGSRRALVGVGEVWGVVFHYAESELRREAKVQKGYMQVLGEDISVRQIPLSAARGGVPVQQKKRKVL